MFFLDADDDCFGGMIGEIVFDTLQAFSKGELLVNGNMINMKFVALMTTANVEKSNACKELLLDIERLALGRALEWFVKSPGIMSSRDGEKGEGRLGGDGLHPRHFFSKDRLKA